MRRRDLVEVGHYGEGEVVALEGDKVRVRFPDRVERLFKRDAVRPAPPA